MEFGVLRLTQQYRFTLRSLLGQSLATEYEVLLVSTC
jgi:hypothetical protein